MTTPDEHRDEIAAQEELIRSIDFLRDLDRVDVARLIGAGGDMHFEPGASSFGRSRRAFAHTEPTGR